MPFLASGTDDDYVPDPSKAPFGPYTRYDVNGRPYDIRGVSSSPGGSVAGGANTYEFGGKTYDLRDVTTAGPLGRGPLEGEGLALNDPYSTASSHLYYGGNRDAAERERAAMQATGLAAQGRGVTLDTRQMDQSTADAIRFGEDLGARAAGLETVGWGDQARRLGPSPAMQDLRRGFDTSSALAMGGAQAARGGMAARAAAGRTAQDIVAGNQQQRAIAGNALSNAERMQAIQALGGYGSALRDQMQGGAFGRADLEMRARGINDAETARREAMGMDIAKLGMQGELARQQERTDFLKQLYGQQARSEAVRVAGEARDVNSALGGFSAGTSAAGQIANRSGSTAPEQQQPQQQPKKQPYNPWDPGY